MLEHNSFFDSLIWPHIASSRTPLNNFLALKKTLVY
jgi:hypothetical protein